MRFVRGIQSIQLGEMKRRDAERRLDDIYTKSKSEKERLLRTVVSLPTVVRVRPCLGHRRW